MADNLQGPLLRTCHVSHCGVEHCQLAHVCGPQCVAVVMKSMLFGTNNQYYDRPEFLIFYRAAFNRGRGAGQSCCRVVIRHTQHLYLDIAELAVRNCYSC